MNSPDARLPHFQLAPMLDTSPESVLRQSTADPLAELFLSLAVVFNDVKGLMWIGEILEDGRPNDGQVSAYGAQWQGIAIQITKLACGLVHELFKLLKNYRGDLHSAEMKRLLKKVPPGVAKKWKSLIALSGDVGTPSSSLAKSLLKIRNNVSFHYDQPQMLVRGYCRHFFELEPSPQNERAYYSAGRNMEETRFYYADAAVQQSLAILRDRSVNDFNEELSRVLRDVNVTLAGIISAFLRRRDAGSK